MGTTEFGGDNKIAALTFGLMRPGFGVLTLGCSCPARSGISEHPLDGMVR
jgi:hypothetical protein